MMSLPKLRPGLDPSRISKTVATIDVHTSAGQPGSVSGLVAFKNSLLAVVEEDSRKVFFYDHKWRNVHETPLNSPKFEYATQMSFDRHNNIIVAQPNENYLLRYNMNGKKLPHLDAPVKGSTGVTCSPEGDIIISSDIPRTILKQTAGKSEWVTLYCSLKEEYEEDPDENFIITDELDPNRYTPHQLSYGSDDELFVATYTCINVLNAIDGKLKRQIGSEEYREGKLSRVGGICATGDGYLFVIDGDYYVHVFTTDGEYLSRFGGNCNEPGRYWHPWGITVDWNGYMLISDVDNGRIHVY